MTEKEKDLDKIFKTLLPILDDLFEKIEEHKEKKEEEEQDAAHALEVRKLSCKIVQAIGPYMPDDKSIMFSSMLDVAASFGCYCQVSKKDQVECFEQFIDANLEVYEKHKVKIEAIKEILRGK